MVVFSAYISSLLKSSLDSAVTSLLSHLPLLQRGNSLAKAEYLTLIPQILTRVIDKGVRIEESRQLLSYSLIHPAITAEERAQFSVWMSHLEERYTQSLYQQPQVNGHCNQIGLFDKQADEWRDSGVSLNGATDCITSQGSEAGLQFPLGHALSSNASAHLHSDYDVLLPEPHVLHGCQSGPSSFNNGPSNQSLQLSKNFLPSQGKYYYISIF